MGTTLSSVHIYGDCAPEESGFSFRSFSPGWLTLTDDLSEGIEYSFRVAKLISKGVTAPVLYFFEFDSEKIEFYVFLNGKMAARYSDDEFCANKRLYDIPPLFGYAEGNRRRISSILACSDTDMKIRMLEEFFGVCLEFVPELSDEAEMLYRERGDCAYLRYREEEKKLSGKAAPFELKKIFECTGKLFYNHFGEHDTKKPHAFLAGYFKETDKGASLAPVEFVGKGFKSMDIEEFKTGRVSRSSGYSLFDIEFYPRTKVTFKEGCPRGFLNKTVVLPGGYYPYDFTDDGMLIIECNRKICIMDETLKIVAKLSIKGDIDDRIGNYLLTTVGDSFCGYCYDPRAKIYIDELINKAGC